MPAIAMLAIAALQQVTQPYTSPPSGDTLGYWQQRVTYTMTATLDEPAAVIRASGTLVYHNNSPDTLRELYFHQYLNAFRPASLWSDVDEREGRVRFQHLRDPNHGFERFTAPPTSDGAPLTVLYPGAPDSTVARVLLARPLAPRDSVVLALQWNARPSTLPRRQGRRGRHWDLAQWYPKVAVYDRGGWQHNAFQPAGELYGEFGSYDVTLILAADQVVAATGVPVAGDPGWSGALREGTVRSMSRAYGARDSSLPSVPSGMKAVRFLAENVHHFAWTTSPQYRYEGTGYARRIRDTRLPVWDTVAVHVLYRPGDDTTWGGGRVVSRTLAAMQWLESIYGPYPYPQMTVVHRLESGGTEFPMLQMNGSPSQGLILHEAGHIWTYGILANNEWRHAWLDEGMTSYQTAWAQRLTPQEAAQSDVVVRRPVPRGYRSLAPPVALSRSEQMHLDQALRDLLGTAQPIGLAAHEFRDFTNYNAMLGRSEVMLGHLRDAIGDSAFLAVLRDFYDRWALKHVDEVAFLASVRRVTGEDHAWFFDQWLRRTGVLDYALTGVQKTRQADGSWTTRASLRRVGEQRHPMPVGVRTAAAGWQIGRLTDPPFEAGDVTITTRDEPLEVRLDPYHVTWDWDRRNDVRGPLASTRFAFDWPFLTPVDRDRNVVRAGPIAWHSDPGGSTWGLRLRSSYLGSIDNSELAIAFATREPVSTTGHRLQIWFRASDFRLPFLRRPAMGWFTEAGQLDAIDMLRIGRSRTYSSSRRTRYNDFAVTYAKPRSIGWLPEQWSDARSIDIHGKVGWRFDDADSFWFVEQSALGGNAANQRYYRVDANAGVSRELSSVLSIRGRLYAAASDNTPLQRSIFISSADPVETFGQHWWRPQGSLLKRPGFQFRPLGGAGLRAVNWNYTATEIAALNVDVRRTLFRVPRIATLEAAAHVFGDVATTETWSDIADAGLGFSVTGRIYDRPVHVRLDGIFATSRPALAFGPDRDRNRTTAPRWALTFSDLW